MGIENAANMTFLHPEKCHVYPPGTSFSLIEKQAEGHAKIDVVASNSCAHLGMDKNVFPILSNQRCADHIVFEYVSADNTWNLHIVELTKSISNSIWQTKLCQQYDGALLNALAIAGVLGIELNLSHVKVYSGFRNNKSLDGSSPVELRAPLGVPQPPNWEHSPAKLPHFPSQKFTHIPVRLNEETGCANIHL